MSTSPPALLTRLPPTPIPHQQQILFPYRRQRPRSLHSASATKPQQPGQTGVSSVRAGISRRQTDRQTDRQIPSRPGRQARFREQRRRRLPPSLEIYTQSPPALLLRVGIAAAVSKSKAGGVLPGFSRRGSLLTNARSTTSTAGSHWSAGPL